jgi:hypothetical protein
LVNHWQSGFYFCEAYSPLSAGDDDWACEFMESLADPQFPELTEIYHTSEGCFDKTPFAQGTTLYLVARTLAAFGRTAEGVDTSKFALCAAFHDQDPIVRFRKSG